MLEHLAIIFVVSSNLGDHIVFRYPNPSEITYAPKRETSTLHYPSWNDMVLLSHSHQLLASLLSPLPQLLETRFQLCIDDITFIGLPSVLRQEWETVFNPDQSKLRRRSSAENPAPELLKEMQFLNEQVDERISQKSMPWGRLHNKSIYPKSSKDIFINESKTSEAVKLQKSNSKSSLKYRGTSVNILGDIYHHHRILPLHPLATEMQMSNSKKSYHSRSPSPDQKAAGEQLTSYHIVFAVRATGHDVQAEFDELFRRAVLPLTAALGQEQVRCGYVRTEAEKLLTMIDSEVHGGWLYF